MMTKTFDGGAAMDTVKLQRPKQGWYWFRKSGWGDWHIVRVIGDWRSPTVRDTWGVKLSWKDWPEGDWVAIPDRNHADLRDKQLHSPY